MVSFSMPSSVRDFRSKLALEKAIPNSPVAQFVLTIGCANMDMDRSNLCAFFALEPSVRILSSYRAPAFAISVHQEAARQLTTFHTSHSHLRKGGWFQTGNV